MMWDDFSAEDYADEETKDTEAAHQLALEAAERQFLEWDYAIGGAELRMIVLEGNPGVLPSPYVAIIRGQSSAAGHGKTGAHPARVASWRELTSLGIRNLADNPLPVWVCFIEPGGNINYSGWLHVLPPAHAISTVVGAERYGWNARKDPHAWDAELTRAERLEFPVQIPAPRDDLFSGSAT